MIQNPKILLAGDYVFPVYHKALSDGFKVCGATVCELVLKDYGSRYQHGSVINSIKLYKAVKKEKPDILFVYRVDNLFAVVLRMLKRRYPSMCIFIYHNDDPYRSDLRRRLKHYNFKRCVKYADITYVYRKQNIDEAYSIGAKNVKLFMSHYMQSDICTLDSLDCHKSNDNVLFVGHYENDNREEYIDYLFKNGVNLHIYGPDNWRKIFEKNNWPLSNLHKKLDKSEYKKKMNEAAIGLAFFSKANRDEYTRRCFEIPVFGTLLMAPETIVTKELFTDGENAVLYTTKESLLKKIQYYNSNRHLRDKITLNGYHHLLSGNFSEIDRAKEILKDYYDLKNQR